MDFNKLVARAKTILLSPTTEWAVIADEPATVSDIFKNYVIWLAALSAIAGFIGNTLVGYSVPFLGHYRMGFGAGLTGAITTYVLSLAGVFLVAYLADALAPTFGGQKNFTQAVKAVAYAHTAAWIAGVGFLVPGLRWLILLAGGIYSIYLLHLGLPYTMKCPPERAWRYTAVTIVAAVMVRWLFGIIAVMGHGEYAVIVGQRYDVQATGRVADIDVLRSAVGSVDLARLESLRNEGVHAN